MSGDESEDEEYFLEPLRDPLIKAEALGNFETLKEKTVNFEELLNELVRRGCLSFEEKFKILSGIVDENTSNKTLSEKCNELYHTLLVKKSFPLSKLFKAWEESGNSYLVGRFDTHFTLEGRDSKSLKFPKFKAIPSHRTEFLTHLHLKQLQLKPQALLKCLRKSFRLESIRLERIRVPYGGRGGEDPANDFDQPLILPNLKEFYFEEISSYGPFKSQKEVNFFLDELNLKPLLFFGLNSHLAWESGLRIEVKLRGVSLLKMVPLSQGGEEGFAEFGSLLRRRPAEYGGWINPKEVGKVMLYECYVPKASIAEGVTQLVLYRCKISSFDPYISSCVSLVQLTLYGEHELSTSVATLDLSSLQGSSNSLRFLSLGYLTVTHDEGQPMSLTLSTLMLDTVIPNFLNESSSFKSAFSEIQHLCVLSTNAPRLSSLLSSSKGIVSEEITVGKFCSEFIEDSEAYQKLLAFLSSSKNSSNFVLRVKEAQQACSEDEELEPEFEDIWELQNSKDTSVELIYSFGHFSGLIPSKEKESWFGLPFKIDEGQEVGISPAKLFRESHGF